MSPRRSLGVLVFAICACSRTNLDVLDAAAPSSSVDATRCASVEPQPLATADMGVFHILLDDTNVYWVDSGTPARQRRILSTPKSGGPSTTLVTFASIGAGPADFAIDDTSLYYFGPADDASSALYRVSKSGGVAEVIANGVSGWTLLADASALYWTDAGAGGILTMPKAGGTPRMLAPRAFGVHAFVQDAERLYWVDGSGQIFSLPKIGGSPTLLARAPGLFVFAAEGSNLYWTDGAVYAMAKTGGVPRVLASTHVFGTVLAVDATGVYTDLDDHMTIVHVLGGDAYVKTAAAGSVRGVGSLAVEPGAIFWGSNGELGGELMRVCNYP